MTKFLGIYRGAALYVIESFESSEGTKLSTKVIAKAMHPERINMAVDFKKEGTNQSQAIKKVKKSIDEYLDEHELEQFVIDLL